MASANDIKKPTNPISDDNLNKIKEILKVNGYKLTDDYKEKIEECELEVFKELVRYLEGFRLERIKDYKDCLNFINKFSGVILNIHYYIIDATKSLSFILDLPGLIEEKENERSVNQEKFFLQFDFEPNSTVNIEEIEQITYKLANDINQYCINKNLDPNNENIMSFLSKDVNAIEIAAEAYLKIALLNPNKIEQIKQGHLFLKFAFESLIEKLEAYQNSDKNKQKTTPTSQVNLDQQPEAPLSDKEEESRVSK